MTSLAFQKDLVAALIEDELEEVSCEEDLEALPLAVEACPHPDLTLQCELLEFKQGQATYDLWLDCTP